MRKGRSVPFFCDLPQRGTRFVAVSLLLCLLFASLAQGQEIPGDANGDGRHGAADISAIVEEVLEQGNALPQAECTGNQTLDVLDVICVLDLIETTAPSIVDFQPKSGVPGTLVTIQGEHLTTPGGTPAQISVPAQQSGSLVVPVTTSSPQSLGFVIPAGAATGPITVTMPERPSATSSASLSILPSSDFTLSIAPSSLMLIQGEAASFAVTMASSNGFSRLATLAVGGLPSGVSATFSPSQIAPGQMSILNLSAGVGAPLGSATLTITASAEVEGIPLQESALASLVVEAVTTTFRGRTVVADALQTPLANVTVSMLGFDGAGSSTGCAGQTTSDAAGNFVLASLPQECTGDQLVRYDGSTATAPPGEYAGVDLVYTLTSGQVTTSPVLVHLPRVDNAETVWVTQNAADDQHFVFSSIPDLETTIYAGTTLSLVDGSQPDPFPLTAVAVPVDRLPEEMPPSSSEIDPFIVAFQPANAKASQPVAVTFPNLLATLPFTAVSLSTLDPLQGTMVIYGTGTVSADGRQIVPDFDPAFPGRRYGIVNFDWHGPRIPPPPRINPAPPGSGPCPQGIKPIDPASGLEILQETDLVIPGPRGELRIDRIYRTLSTEVGPFGVGSSHGYSHRLDTNNPSTAALVNLVLPGGSRVPFVRSPDGLLRNSSVPKFFGGTLTTPSSGPSILRLEDGSELSFQISNGALGSVLQSIRDRFGHTTTLIRNSGALAQITEIRDPVGRRLLLNYDGADRITQITDPIGRQVSYTYNSQGTLESVTDAGGGVTSYSYDSQNRLLTVTDARGIIVASNTYDGAGRAIEQVQGDGGVWSFTYTLTNPLVPTSPIAETWIVDPEGHSTRYRFNPQGFLVSVLDALGQQLVLDREEGSNRLLGVSGAAECSLCGTNPTAGDVLFQYDTAGNITSTTDQMGQVTEFTYDASSRQLTEVRDALGHVSQFSYSPFGLLTEAVDGRGVASFLQYNSLGDLQSLIDGAGFETQFEHDGFGNLISMSDPLGEETRWAYDALSRPVEQVGPSGRRTLFEYHDVFGVSAIRGPGPESITFQYDEVGNLLSVADVRGNTTSYVYDELNRMVSRVDSVGAMSQWEYDRTGNIVRSLDRRGEEGIYQYDPLGRLVREEYADSSVDRAYDPRGRLVEVFDSQSGLFSFSYDANGRLSRASGPVGTVVYQRDALGQVSNRQVLGHEVAEYTYDPVGNLLSASLGSLSVDLTWENRNLLDQMNHSVGTSSSYTYDSSGRLLALDHRLGATEIFTQAHGYDRSGYRTSSSVNTDSLLLTPASLRVFDSESNRLLQDGAATFAYDEGGRRSSRVTSEGATDYTWDSRGRLSSLTYPDGAVKTLTYDFSGNLIGVSSAGNGGMDDRLYVRDEIGNVLAYTDQGLAVTVLSGFEIDQYFGQVHPGSGIQVGLTDSLESTVAVVDELGAVVARLSYEPFGETHLTGSSTYPFRFLGKTSYDEDLYDFRARVYDSATGLFLSEDPLDFVGGDPNLYRYGLNNPTNLTDPTGEFVVAALGVIAIGYVAYTAYQKGRAFIDAAERYGDSTQACVDLIDAKPGCDEEELLRRCQGRNRDFTRALSKGLEFGASVPGTSLSGPPPTSAPEAIAEGVKALATP
ncbi:MAG: IPT/TIG domain-containing protein [Deltaproteobacteria bacterium]|nr:IPT/TIG domain-containing protein [Deltaproteobacteria bacterium]